MRVLAALVILSIPLFAGGSDRLHEPADVIQTQGQTLSGTVVDVCRGHGTFLDAGELHVAAVDENGRTQEYVCESHGFTQLSRIGLTRTVLKAGTEVRLEVPLQADG